MDIDRINRRHFIETDMYYRIELGLSSRLLRFENGVFHLELTLGKKWKKNYNAAAAEIAYSWKNANEELKDAIACKVYIVDVTKSPYKEVLLQNKIQPEYDARKGILFRRYHLN